MTTHAYIRVSTEEQAESGLSLAAQRQRLEAYVAMRQLPPPVWYEDTETTRVPLVRRSYGCRLVRALKPGDHVIALKLDRLFRNVIETLQTAQAWTDRGIALHVLDMGGATVDTSSAMGWMFLTITAAFAEMERRLIEERTKTALAEKRRRGEKTGGHVPYGYVCAEREGRKVLLEDAAEREIIVRMAAMVDSGESLRAVAAHLNESKIRTRTGVAWTHTTIAGILARE